MRRHLLLIPFRVDLLPQCVQMRFDTLMQRELPSLRDKAPHSHGPSQPVRLSGDCGGTRRHCYLKRHDEDH
jgi:hypothetical protein